MTNIHDVLAQLSLKEKIGQLICPLINLDAYGEVYEPYMAEALLEHQFGGYIVVGEAQRLQRVIHNLQTIAKVPLLMAADIECGAGQMLRGASIFPPNMAIGATEQLENSYLKGKYTALEARKVGVNWAFAPVVDINNNPENPIINVRAFGESRDSVSEMGAAFIKGCQEHGVLASAKHFPGHGDTSQDSHTSLPTITRSAEDFDNFELHPFKAAIEAGVGSIMTAHIAIPALEKENPELPATLSHAIMTTLLRDKLGFKGVIVTDAMIMEGVKGEHSAVETALQAIEAGCDMILMPENPADIASFFLEAVENGRLSEERLNLSVLRILEIKQQFKLWEDWKTKHDLSSIFHPETLAISEKMFYDSLTLVCDKQQLLPLEKNSQTLHLMINDDMIPGLGQTWLTTLSQYNSNVYHMELDWKSEDETFENIRQITPQFSYYIISLFTQVKAWKDRLSLEPRALKLIQDFAEKELPCVVISFGNPYLIGAFPNISTYACAYLPYYFAEQGMAKALYGELEFKGTLPIQISGKAV